MIRISDHDLGRLVELARGRPIVVDHFASRRCGVTIGDLRVRFGADLGDTRTESLGEVAGLPVVAESAIVPVLERGRASLQVVGAGIAPRPAVRLEQPDTWLDFLHSHPHSRR